MSNNIVVKHLTVTGFASDKKPSPISKIKSGKESFKQAKKNMLNAKADVRDVFKTVVQDFKKTTSEKNQSYRSTNC